MRVPFVLPTASFFAVHLGYLPSISVCVLPFFQ